jgi:hypothetical protein
VDVIKKLLLGLVCQFARASFESLALRSLQILEIIFWGYKSGFGVLSELTSPSVVKFLLISWNSKMFCGTYILAPSSRRSGARRYREKIVPHGAKS